MDLTRDFTLTKVIDLGWNMPVICFGKDSDVISGESLKNLDDIYNTMKEFPDLMIKITGHTSFDEKDHSGLSVSRAKNIADYLIAKGMDSRYVLSQGSGSKNPLLLLSDHIMPDGTVLPKGTVLSKKVIKNNFEKDSEEYEYIMKLSRGATFSVLKK